MGLDIGGTKIAAGTVDREQRVTVRAQRPTPTGSGPYAILHAAADLVREVVSRADGPVFGLGIASGGVVDRRRGVIFSAVGTIPDWTGTAVGPALEEMTGLPTAVENDVNAIALAETHFGCARSARSTLVVAVGTGIGGAIVIDGQLWRGRTGTAGELGHIVVAAKQETGQSAPLCPCGRRGHLEALASGPTIARRWAVLTASKTVPTLEGVGSALERGDEAAITVVSEAGAILGRALGGLSNALDVELIVLAGGVLSLGPCFIDRLVAAHSAETLPGPHETRIVVSSLGADAGILGGAIVAVQDLPHEPGFFAMAPSTSENDVSPTSSDRGAPSM